MSAELQQEIAEARERLARLESAARGDRPCPHVNVGRQSVTGGGVRKRVSELTGYTLPNAGYQVWECIACGDYTLRSYGGEKIGTLTPEAARQLIG